MAEISLVWQKLNYDLLKLGSMTEEDYLFRVSPGNPRPSGVGQRRRHHVWIFMDPRNHAKTIWVWKEF
jgi:hypothetical protein